jgi:Protein of unknown function (DUF3829)
MICRAWGLAVALASSTGCMLLESSEQQDAAERHVEIDPADYAEHVDAKLRRFSACRDVLASIMLDSWDRYVDQVGEDGKPKHRREGVYLRALGDNVFRSCRRVVEAAESPPRMPVIEYLLISSVDFAARYADLTRDLGQYLDSEEWQEDDWETLALIDVQLRAAHAEWLTADRALQQAIDVRHIENDSILLGVLEGRRSPLEVASRKVMIRARPMVRCLSDDTLESVASCQSAHAAFEQAASDFSRIYNAQRSAADKVFWMGAFASDVEEFRGIASDLIDLGARKSKPADLQALTDGYSSLVRDAETLDFDFP